MRPFVRSFLQRVCIVVFVCAGCSHDAFDDINASEGHSAVAWMLEPRTDADVWGPALDRARWEFVAEADEPTAETLLARTSYLHLSSDELVRFAPGRQVTGTPYLVRGVAAAWPRNVQTTANMEIKLDNNGDLWIAGEALSHHPVPIERRALIIWLERPPREVYVTFGVAE